MAHDARRDDTDVTRLVHQAGRLAARLRDDDPQTVWIELAALDRLRLEQLCCALAAMVNVDQTPSRLLAWIDETPTGQGRIRRCRECDDPFLARHDQPSRCYCKPECARAARRRKWRLDKARRRAKGVA